MNQPSAAGVVLASGAGTRVGAALNKVYLPLAGRRIVSWSLAAFARVPEIGPLVLVARPQDVELVEEVVEGADAPVEVVPGGSSRQESELNALRHLTKRVESGEVDAVLLHDGARPLVTPELIIDVLRVAREHGGAMPGLAADDIVRADCSRLDGSVVRAQTPQGFRAAALIEAYEQAAREGYEGTDTASVMERFSSLPVHWVPGDERNFKVTYPHDLLVAGQVLSE